MLFLLLCANRQMVEKHRCLAITAKSLLFKSLVSISLKLFFPIIVIYTSIESFPWFFNPSLNFFSFVNKKVSLQADFVPTGI